MHKWEMISERVIEVVQLESIVVPISGHLLSSWSLHTEANAKIIGLSVDQLASTIHWQPELSSRLSLQNVSHNTAASGRLRQF